MIERIYNKRVRDAFKLSMQRNPLIVPKNYITSKHGIRHTTVIHLKEFMENKKLSPSSNFLVATYLAGESYIPTYINNYKTKRYVEMIEILRENNIKKTINMFNEISDDEIIYLLIHLWVNLLFLDYVSKDKETKNFIFKHINYTNRVVRYLTKDPEKTKDNKAFYTIIDVLFTELGIITDSKTYYKGAI